MKHVAVNVLGDAPRSSGGRVYGALGCGTGNRKQASSAGRLPGSEA